MRKLILSATLASTFLLSLTASAGTTSKYFTAVLNSAALEQAISDGSTITSMTLTATYRCPGCYRFEVDTEKMSSDGSEKTMRRHAFTTMLNLNSKKITVKSAE